MVRQMGVGGRKEEEEKVMNRAWAGSIHLCLSHWQSGDKRMKSQEKKSGVAVV